MCNYKLCRYTAMFTKGKSLVRNGARKLGDLRFSRKVMIRGKSRSQTT